MWKGILQFLLSSSFCPFKSPWHISPSGYMASDTITHRTLLARRLNFARENWLDHNTRNTMPYPLQIMSGLPNIPKNFTNKSWRQNLQCIVLIQDGLKLLRTLQCGIMNNSCSCTTVQTRKLISVIRRPKTALLRSFCNIPSFLPT